jgi:ABC-type multidrug transport system ATPase subunit
MIKKDIFQIEAESISKKYSGRAALFSNFNLSIQTGESFAITGHNGSGKSTLLKILSGICQPDKGTVKYKKTDTIISREELYNYIGFSSPEINPYDELTGFENINFAIKKEKSFPEKLIDDLNLKSHIHKRVKFYSTGMKQRLKFILALIREPDVLFLDEPGSSLDSEGKELVYEIIRQMKKDMIIIIATNETDEADICSRVISLG